MMAYAYYCYEEKDVESNFKVVKGSECFNVLEHSGFTITVLV